jgi:hypothetical protein
MNSDDKAFLGIMSIPVTLVVGLFVLLGMQAYHASTGENQKTIEVTDRYSLPPELAGCRVYWMQPAGFGRGLYVVSRDGQPKGVAWETREGKNHTRRHDVALEVE